MATYSNTAREVEMPNGDVVVIHNAPTGGENTTSNIKKFKYDDNGHVTESTAANATDLNLNSYSTPTTGSTAIGTSDAVQTAIGKLDHQSQIDQTNILLVKDATEELVDEGAKNIFDITTPDSLRDTTVTPLENGGAKLSCNNATWTQYHKSISTKTGEKYKVAVYIDSITGSIGSDLGIYVKRENAQDDDPYFELHPTSTGVYTADLTALTSVTTISIYINNSGTSKTLDVNMRVMVCSEADWKISQNYAPFALPNYDLTQLEAEDRASLAEVVDSGAKNRIDLSDLEAIKALNTYGSWNGNVYTYDNSTTFTFNEDGTIGVATVGTIQSQAGCNLIVPTTLINGEEYVISGCPAGGSSGATNGYMLDYQYNRDGSVHYILDTGDGARFTYSSSDSVVKILIIIRPQTNISSGLVFKPMICTEEAWKVSQNYAPFALPNTDLTRLEAEDRTALAEEIDAGAKNILKINKASSASASCFTSDLANTVTINGTIASSGDAFDLNRINGSLVLPAGNYVISTPDDMSDLAFRYYERVGGTLQNQVSERGEKFLIFTVSGSATENWCRLETNVGTVFSNRKVRIMICTLADWKISPKFVPYRPNWDLVSSVAPFFTVPINHNMIYRGNNLGATLTDAQHTALSSGNFTDLYLGDYWTKTVTIPDFYELTTAQPDDWTTNYTSYYTKSGNTYTAVTGSSAPTWAADTYYQKSVPTQTVTLKAVIADFDTFYAGYNSTYAAINTHHAAVIVTGFSNVVWNKTNSTAGGYVNSLIHKWLVGSALPQIETWFGSAKVLSHQKLLTNAITGDAASGWAWSSQKISLLSECQLYGMKVWGGSKATNGAYEPGEAFKHLNVFNHIDANLLFGSKNIWLRDIASAGGAAYLDNGGVARDSGTSIMWLAPAALILLS